MSPAPTPKQSPESKKLKALHTLWEKRRVVFASLMEIDEEIADIIGGNSVPAERMKAVAAAWKTAWEGRYHTPYVWSKERDYPAMRRLVKHLTTEDIAARIVVYLKRTDAIFMNAMHSFGMFVATINQHVAVDAAQPLFETTAAVDCRHTPRCADDIVHSARVRRERWMQA